MLIVSWSATFFLKRRHSLAEAAGHAMVPMSLSGWLATLAAVHHEIAASLAGDGRLKTATPSARSPAAMSR